MVLLSSSSSSVDSDPTEDPPDVSPFSDGDFTVAATDGYRERRKPANGEKPKNDFLVNVLGSLADAVGVVEPLAGGVSLSGGNSDCIPEGLAGIRFKAGGDSARGDSRPETEDIGESDERGVLRSDEYDRHNATSLKINSHQMSTLTVSKGK
jgi:hypothetical protein